MNIERNGITQGIWFNEREADSSHYMPNGKFSIIKLAQIIKHYYRLEWLAYIINYRVLLLLKVRDCCLGSSFVFVDP